MNSALVIFLAIFYHFLFGKCCAIRVIVGKRTMEAEYKTGIIEAEDKPDDLCDLTKEQKLALCNHLVITIDHEILVPAYGMRQKFLFNKMASYTLAPNCVTRTLKFTHTDDLMNSEKSQAMFPCYGRNRPMRTNWVVDDNFDLIYLSGGHQPNSVFMFVHLKFVDTDTYEFYKLILDFEFLNLNPVQITWNDMRDEIMTLNEISHYVNFCLMEVNYIRELVMKENQWDPICNLNRVQKVSLCRNLTVTSPYYYYYRFEVTAFNDRSTDCEHNRIAFKCSFTKDYTDQDIRRNMYPCYGEYTHSGDETPLYYLATGYRPNTALVYRWDVETSTFYFYSFVENLPATYVPTEVPRRINEVLAMIDEKIGESDSVADEDEELIRQMNDAFGIVAPGPD